MDTRREFETWIEDNSGYDESALAAEFCASRKWDDIGLAERLEARFAPVLRYGSGGWIAYNGKSWERNARDTAVAFGKQSARAIADESDYLGDEATREKHAGFAKKACGKAAIDNALALAQPALKIDDSEFDRSAELLNAPNGTALLQNSPREGFTW